MSQLKQRERSGPSSSFSLYLGPRQMGGPPPASGQPAPPQSADSDVNFFWKHPMDTPRNEAIPAVWASWSG